MEDTVVAVDEVPVEEPKKKKKKREKAVTTDGTDETVEKTKKKKKKEVTTATIATTATDEVGENSKKVKKSKKAKENATDGESPKKKKKTKKAKVDSDGGENGGDVETESEEVVVEAEQPPPPKKKGRKPKKVLIHEDSNNDNEDDHPAATTTTTTTVRGIPPETYVSQWLEGGRESRFVAMFKKETKIQDDDILERIEIQALVLDRMAVLYLLEKLRHQKGKAADMTTMALADTSSACVKDFLKSILCFHRTHGTDLLTKYLNCGMDLEFDDPSLGDVLERIRIFHNGVRNRVVGEDSDYPCKFCRSKKTRVLNTVQKRALDEPAHILVFCRGCRSTFFLKG